ncbi:hypothetical protein I7I53_00054 [Histoplasma capsulatum var. duboisii H88]|uniref:Uncharacterized protein n=1 Tax=Ajellomyces capsulatus (strain H88) TaxID=544711 RepID=A0A8A1LFW3_AJEC8|nr:hypothetical protein I7I53_00054 [Histoplasma capsulatum var. duboisii H88]
MGNPAGVESLNAARRFVFQLSGTSHPAYIDWQGNRVFRGTVYRSCRRGFVNRPCVSGQRQRRGEKVIPKPGGWKSPLKT